MARTPSSIQQLDGTSARAPELGSSPAVKEPLGVSGSGATFIPPSSSPPASTVAPIPTPPPQARNARSRSDTPQGVRTTVESASATTSRRRIQKDRSRISSCSNTNITVIPKHRCRKESTLRSPIPLLFDPRPKETCNIAMVTANKLRAIRTKILELQIKTKQFELAQAVVAGLHELLLDLTPLTSPKNPKPDFHAIAWGMVEDEPKLRRMVHAAGRLLYKKANDRVFLQGWWHAEQYPARLLEKDVVEFEGWV